MFRFLEFSGWVSIYPRVKIAGDVRTAQICVNRWQLLALFVVLYVQGLVHDDIGSLSMFPASS